ncbi:phospholipase D family protein [Pararobbsia alpina]|uniref:Cardiolipin synthase C n=1 Tax=Pararobbsia alpina TaxID=621374 RepID=A0A6S7C731_9BURK|nr:phospholipase D family protein [Pararobbsia alpina]CAB3802663.1 Cardiolipin synthase C [Pararobbsia alpina]
MRVLRKFTIAVSLSIWAAMLAGCSLPLLENRTHSVALTTEQAQDTRLGRAIAAQLSAHAGLTGIDPLVDSRAAFAARVNLARAAQRTLDVQYYIWRNDLTGILLLEELHEAADRGVRVRLLLDDNGIPSSLDEILAALDAHPNIEVRLFNPFAIRRPKATGFLPDFSRLNRRMHNKSFTADSAATIIGGRNIGNEYFGATDGVVFADLDVLAVGPAAADVARDFDRYWASASSYPARQILSPAALDRLDALGQRARKLQWDPAAAAYVDAIRETPDVRELLESTLPFEWARTRMISDDPAKVLNRAPPTTLVLSQLREILGDPERELDLVSPYFVPAETGTRYFTQLASSGTRVRVLTNSLEATDVVAVHSGYARRRVELLNAGVELFELRRSPHNSDSNEESTGVLGSSGSSLHAKTFAVDGKRVFVGSLNFDPRSANLNTELGFVIDSPELARRIESIFSTLGPQLAYFVRLDSNGNLYWLEQRGNAVVRHDTEPHSAWTTRLGVWFFSILPIEWLL